MSSASCAPSRRRRASTSARPANFGAPWRIEKFGINVKLYPMCFGSHRILDAMVDTCAANNIAARDIAGGRRRTVASQFHQGAAQSPPEDRAGGEVQRRVCDGSGGARRALRHR